MRSLLIILSLAAWALAGSGPAWAQLLSPARAGAPHIAASLQAEDATPAPGETVTLAFAMRPEPGWHGYWENPGDAGKGLELDWTLPRGVTVGTLHYPVPQTLLVSGLMNHVYEANYAVLVDLRVPAGLKAGTPLPVKVNAQWLACTDAICVPEQGRLALDLIVGPPGTAPDNRERFDAWRRALPRPLGGEAVFQAAGETLRLSIPYPRTAALDKPHFFPLATGAKSYAAQQDFHRARDRLVVTLRDLPQGLLTLDGVLGIGPERGLLIQARRGVVPEPAGNAAGQWISVLAALSGAILGGLILNIMPCVFPILSLKAMSLLRASASSLHARRDSWAYAAGAVVTCTALGGAMLLLRAGGESIGWAFQLQSPGVVLLLLALSVAIALNLAGVYRLAPLQIDGGLSTRPGMWGDFWGGVLVAFVATPCTGPFMATALGAALLLPVPAALAVFAGLGIGLALPFVLLAYVPALQRALPRPGPWMERAQRWLSVPMALTAAALLWLLWRQAGVTGLTLGAVTAAGLGLALWWLGRAQASHRRFRGVIAGAACAILLSGAAVPLLARFDHPVAGKAANAFNEHALASARASGKPVFVYFTADWCLTCKVNEAGAIETTEVRTAFDRAGVRTLVGDWTNGDPEITRFLEGHGRSGVPLYLWYPANGAPPQELAQILTPSMLVSLADRAR